MFVFSRAPDSNGRPISDPQLREESTTKAEDIPGQVRGSSSTLDSVGISLVADSAHYFHTATRCRLSDTPLVTLIGLSGSGLPRVILDSSIPVWISMKRAYLFDPVFLIRRHYDTTNLSQRSSCLPGLPKEKKMAWLAEAAF